MTRNEAYEEMVSGKNVTHNKFGSVKFCYLDKEENKFMCELYDGRLEVLNLALEDRDGYEIYQEPVQKVTWYQVIYNYKSQESPLPSGRLYKTKGDFLAQHGPEEKFEWIELIPVLTR